MPADPFDEAIDAPEIIIVNARVRTGDARRPWADAVLVQGGVLVAVGSSAELRKRAGARATRIDAGGLLLRAQSASSPLVIGDRANLMIVERMDSEASHASVTDDLVVFSLVDGRIVVDRDGLDGGRER